MGRSHESQEVRQDGHAELLAKTITNIHGSVIAPVFELAVGRGYVRSNPCRRVRLPERKGRPVESHHVLDVDQMPDWIDCPYEVDVDTGEYHSPDPGHRGALGRVDRTASA